LKVLNNIALAPNEPEILKVVIIDDEARARRILKSHLKENCPEVEVVDEAEDVLTGIKSIQTHHPDLIFLDIEMPGYTGFQLLEFFDDPKFNVIITTAFDHYAVQAFQFSAIDYLLKPIDEAQLKESITKAFSLRSDTKIKERFEALNSNLEKGTLQKIALPLSKGLQFVSVKDIIYLEAEGAYTSIFLKNDSKILVSKKIKDFELMLNSPNSTFFRTHRSFIINLSHIKRYVKSEGGHIKMDNDALIQISREKKEEFDTKIEKFKI